MIERDKLLLAEQGNAECMYEVGMFYLAQDCHSLAFYWISRSANKKHALAMFQLGNFYRNGTGTEIDVKLAHKWYKKASKLKVVSATTALVGDIFCGALNASQKNTHFLCKQASKQDKMIAEYYLGLCYFRGIGVKRNLEKARAHFTISAINGFEGAQLFLRDKAFGINV